MPVATVAAPDVQAGKGGKDGDACKTSGTAEHARPGDVKDGQACDDGRKGK